MNLSPAWRARLPVLAVLGILLVANTAVLVGYRLYYEERFHGLRKEEEALRARRDEARATQRRARGHLAARANGHRRRFPWVSAGA